MQPEDVLSQVRIFIDTFKLRRTGTFLLTHLHTDHAQIPARFRCKVWTTTPNLLEKLHPNVRVRTMKYDEWYRSSSGVPFRVIPTTHAPWSCGFYFPTLHLLHLGDGTLNTLPMIPESTVPLHIVYDGLLEAYHLPSRNIACDALYDAIRSYPTIKCVHYGIVSILRHCVPLLKFRLDPSLDQISALVAQEMDIVDVTSPYLLVGSSHTTATILVPSMMWFYRCARDGLDIDPDHVYEDGRYRRVFVNTHATKYQIERLKNQFATYTFSPVRTRPAF